MISDIKRAMRRLTPLEMASRELSVAQLALLEAHTGCEYAEALVVFNAARVKRLRAFIAAQTKDEVAA